MLAEQVDYVRPFLKWPGGKYRLIRHLSQHFPDKPIFIEPFVGAGAVFLNHPAQAYYLNDFNADLIHCHELVKKSPSKYINEAKFYFNEKHNSEKRYYQYRRQFNQCDDPFKRSALFLYLNRHGFNGLCRYNSKGEYNVPFGRYIRPYFPEKELRHFHLKAQSAQFFNLDFAQFFEKMLKKVNPKKCIFYCDPPYAPLSKTSNFTSYAGNQFGPEQQIELAMSAEEANKLGATVIISNHDTSFTRNIYKQAKIIPLAVQRVISCKGDNRMIVKELIAIYQ